MSKKKVLIEEGAVRQFMKLANLTPLSEEFVSDLYESEEEVVEEGEEEVVEEGGDSKGDESDTDKGEEDYTTKKGKKKKTSSPGRGEKKGDEAFVNEDDDLTEVNLEEGLGGALAAGAASKLGGMAMDAVTGGDDEEVNEEEEIEAEEELVATEELPEEGGDIDVTSLVQAITSAISAETGVDIDVAGDSEEEPELEPELDMAPEEEVPMPDEEAPAMRGYEENMDKVVSAIAERVMQRVTGEKKKEDAASLVAERVLKRIEKLSKK